MRRRNRDRSRNRVTPQSDAAPAIRQMSAEDYARQNDLVGILSYELLVDPVRIRGENTPGAYERTEITRWLSQPNGGRSPTTRNRASVNDLVPAEDIQEEIRGFVARYRDSDIVRAWLQEQPAWYTRVARRIRDTAAPAIATMSRTGRYLRLDQRAQACAHCCSKAAKAGAGAAVGSAVGACAGCACAAAALVENDESTADDDEANAAFAATATATGAAIGAVYGAVVGPEECLRLGGEAVNGYCRNLRMQNEREMERFWGDVRRGGKKKTRKNKRKKRPKTRRRRKSRRKKTRKKRGKGPAFSKTSGMVRRRKELRNEAKEEARKKFLEKYDEYMKEKGDKTGILPSSEQMNEWVKESRKNVFHPNTDYYTEKKYKGIKYTAQKGGKRRRKRKSKKKKRR